MHKWLGLIGLLLGTVAGAQGLQACGGTPGLPAWAQAGVYSGTLGPSAITLRLNPQDMEARYFYVGRAADLFLTPSYAGKTLILQEEVRQDSGAETTVSGCFTLEKVGPALRGTWKAPGTARTLRVSLEALNVARVPLKLPPSPGLVRLRRSDPLAFLKLNHAWGTAADGRSVREPLSGLTYPRVAGASAALEAALQDRLLDNAALALECASQLPQTPGEGGGGYRLSAGVTLLTPRLLSVREEVEYSCGGAHPGGGTTGVILDRVTGRRLSVQTLWPSLTPARLKALYLGAPASDPDSECDDILREMTASFAAFLGSAGLNLTPDSLPHVAAACAETVMVPYGQLRAGANRASLYFADLYSR